METNTESILLFREVNLPDSSHERIWLTADGGYRIIWRDEAFGVSIQSGYQASVLCRHESDFPWWEFAWQRRRFRTFAAAEKACQRNFRVWSRFVKLSQAKGRREKRLNRLDERFDLRGRGLPAWVAERVTPEFIKLLVDRPRQTATNARSTREAIDRIKRKFNAAS